MSEREGEKGLIEETAWAGPTETQAGDPCAHIEDPVRRGLCRICQVPVVGEAPFCRDHEPPVP